MFGILHRSHGRLEYQTLTITTGAVTSGGTITITLDGTGTNVDVVNGDSIQDVVRAINAVSFDQWFDDAFGIDVIFSAHLAGDKTGSFSLAAGGTGVVGAFSESITGVTPTEEFINQADWNLDNVDGDGDTANESGFNLDPSKGNVYEVQFQWLGFGTVLFSVENPDHGRFIDVHELKFANANTLPSLQNPTLPIGLLVDNGTSTTDVTIESSSMAVFTEGDIVENGLLTSTSGTATGDLTTETCVLALFNKVVFQSVENRVNYQPDLLTFSANGAGAAKFTTLRAVLDPILGGPVTYTDISTATSIVAASTNGTTVTGGTVIATFNFGSDVESFVLDLTNLSSEREPGTLLCFTVEIDGGTSDVDIGLVWRELF